MWSVAFPEQYDFCFNEMPVAHSESFGTHDESCGSQGTNKDSFLAVNDSVFHDFLLSAHEESFINNGLFRALNKSYGANKKLLPIMNHLMPMVNHMVPLRNHLVLIMNHVVPLINSLSQ